MSTGPQQPRRLGKYELQTRLGHGGMADVWKAFDPHLQRYVAIKLIRTELMHDPDFSERFEREARLIASLNHPNVVKIHDFQVSQPPESETPTAYMVMDYVKGQTLADYIRSTSRRGNIPSWEDIVYLFTLTSRGLDYAHQKGMIHRDIKPANILLDQRPLTAKAMGEPILTDFGVARLQNVQTGTVVGSLVGTPIYISPEQALGQHSDWRCDLYSLGIILYEVTTGVTPFRGDTTIAIIMQHVHELPTPPTLINPQITQAVSEVILKSIAKRPEDRFDSAMAMTTTLAQLLNIRVPGLQSTQNTPPILSSKYSIQPTPPPLSQTPSGLTPGRPLLNTQHPIQVPEELTGSQTPRPLLGATNTPIMQQQLTNTPVRSASSIPVASSPQQIQYTQPWSKRINKRTIILVAMLVVVLIGASLGIHALVPGTPTTPTSPIVGRIVFTQSANAGAGNYDQIQIDMHNVPAPPSGHVYYAWLVTGTLENSPAHWLLPYNNGNPHLDHQSYTGHANLLNPGTTFLVTKEQENSSPTVPYTDPSTHLYYAQVAQSSSTTSFDIRPCPTGTTSTVCLN
jgi:serine/threonine protein kinase